MKEFVEKLIGRLEEINPVDYGSIGSYEAHLAVKDCLRDVERTVNQLAEEMGVSKTENTTWILCSERLPAYFYNVLVCTENGGRTIAHIRSLSMEWRDMYMTEVNNVIAWQPLPAPYQKGE